MPSSSAHTLERRQSPRTELQSFVYLKLDESNHGSVLNISERGLCFRSIHPVNKAGTVSFSLSDGNHQVDGTGELIWTNEAQKTGGLLFTALSAAATRELVETWVSPPRPARGTGAALEPLPPNVAVLQANPSQPERQAGPSRLFRLTSALSQLVPQRQLRVLSASLLLLISGVVAGAFFQSYRREFGELLIGWGQRFTAQNQAQTSGPAAAPAGFASQRTAPAESTTTQPSSAVRPEPQLANKRSFSEREKATGVEPNTVKHYRAATVASLNTISHANAPDGALTLPVTVPPSWLPSSAAPISSSVSTEPHATPLPRLADQTSLRSERSQTPNVISTSEMYCDVGRFKDPLQASDIIKELALMGFPATTVQKGHLWTSAYHVLVGPYSSVQQFKTARKSLVSRGFQAKPFEKGSRSFTLLSSLTLDGAQVPSGDYIISWESYVSEATVRFLRHNAVVTATEGRWVKRSNRHDQDAYIYRPNPDGSKTLLEIRFAGMHQALVFSKSY